MQISPLSVNTLLRSAEWKIEWRQKGIISQIPCPLLVRLRNVWFRRKDNEINEQDLREVVASGEMKEWHNIGPKILRAAYEACGRSFPDIPLNLAAKSTAELRCLLDRLSKKVWQIQKEIKARSTAKTT